MEETTPTNLLTGQWGATLDYVCTHKPVKIVADNRHAVVMVLATDYLDMVNEIERKDKLIKSLMTGCD